MDYLNVIADKKRLLTNHYTPGRGGAKIEFITRHHNAGVRMTTEDCWLTWQTREASAHYQVEVDGTVGQIVNDWDTAWANANLWANQRTIAIEHANSGGPAQDWPISSATIIGGARLAAALCLYYGLGRPNYGTNIRDHSEFSATGCPYHLAFGRKYHNQWMQEAQRFYDYLKDLKNGKVQGHTIITTNKPEDQMLTIKYFADYIQGWGKGFFGPQFAKLDRIVKKLDQMEKRLEKVEKYSVDSNAQLTGSTIFGHYPGWPNHIGRTEDGKGLTVVSGIGAIRKDIENLKKEGK